MQVSRHLVRVRVDEEVDPRPPQCAAGLAGRRNKVGWVGVGEELGDDARLADDLAVVVDGGDEATGVDLKILRVTGAGEINDDFLVWNLELVKSNVRSVSPWSA